jgi:AcrR family transcriptional regulator
MPVLTPAPAGSTVTPSMAAVEAKIGLRERKKRRTRETIVAVATRLFVEQGYERTTTAQIADAAEVSQSTFFTYFRTKADVVFSLYDALIESADARLRERQRGESAADALVAWISCDLPEVEAIYPELLHESDRLMASDPELQAQARLRSARFEDVLADAFGRDLGEPADGVRARVLAAIAWRGMSDVWNTWHRTHASDEPEDIQEICSGKADYVRRALDAGLQAVELLPRPA